MKKLISAFALVAVLFVGFANCDGGSNEPGPVAEIRVRNFVYVLARDADGISTLNSWLQTNPNKKVVSFSGVLEYREGNRGYVLYFVSGDNSRQRFARINLNDGTLRDTYGVYSLQVWKNTHLNAQIVAISTVPAYSGGVRELIICYEQ